MVPRQLWIFRFGCWVAFVAAAVHLAGHLAGPAAPANDTERQLAALAASYRYTLPGGAHRTLMDFLDGFSLMFALLVAALGALGLITAKRGRRILRSLLQIAPSSETEALAASLRTLSA